MISRKHRFRGQKTIEYIYRKGRQTRAGFLSLKAVPSKKGDYRLSVVVSRKVNKSAVVRNRIRRRIYEQIRLIRKDRQQPINYDMVLSVYDDKIAKIPSQELKLLCEKLLRCLEEPKHENDH